MADAFAGDGIRAHKGAKARKVEPRNGAIIKLIADRRTGVLIGATAVGPPGGEILSMLTLAVHVRIPLKNIRSMIYAFPTFSGGIGEEIGAYGRGVTTVLVPEYTGLKELDPLIEALGS